MANSAAVTRFVFDERFAQAFLHNPHHKVLGKELSPVSLWHKLQLEYVNSPVMSGGSVSVSDLILAVEICRTQFPVMATLNVPKRGLRRTLWLLWAERVNMPREMKSFTDYCEDYCSMPKIEMAKKGEKVPDMDYCLSDVALYRKMSGSPRDETWNIPLGELAWMNAAFSRSEGADFCVETPLDEARKMRMREHKYSAISAIKKRLMEEGLSDPEASDAAEKEYRSRAEAASEKASRKSRR